MMAAWRRLARGWGAAVRFLTVAPWGRWEADAPEDLGCAAALFPLVGALIGLGVAGTRAAVLALGASPALAAALALVAWVALTGGLHLDGLMDAADGLLGGQTAARRLEIMRDERVGAFGVLAAGLVLLTKYAALQTAPGAGVVLAATTGRWMLTTAMARFPYARPQGLGGMWHAQVTRRSWWAATAVTLAIALLWPEARLWAALAAGALAGWWLARWASRRIPGLTGDVYGGLAELTESVVLVAAAWLVAWPG